MRGEMTEDRQLENRFRTVFELTAVGMTIANPQGQFIQTNQAFRDILGYTDEELQNFSCIELTHPEDRAENLSLCRELLAGERSQFTIEKRYFRKDGSVVWVNLSTTLVWGANGLPEYAIASVQDISDTYRELRLRKEAESELQKNREQLEQRVKERTAELAQANMQLQQEIAERQEIQEQLQAQKEFLQTVIDNNPNIIFVKDGEGKFILVNQALADMCGKKIDEFLGKTDADFCSNPSEIEKFQREDRAVLTTWQPQIIPEIAYKTASGKIRYLQGIKKPLLSPDGKTQLILGVGTDITERKLLMEALKENEQCLKAVLDAVPGSVSWISAEGQYLGVNQHLAKTLKLSPEDFTGKYLGFLNNSPQFVDFMKEFLHNNAQTSQEIFEIIVDGLTRYYLINAQKYQEGDQAVVVGIDITEKQQSKLEIQIQKEFLQNIIDTNPSLIYVKDREGRYVLANKTFAKCCGLTIPDLLGKTTNQLHENSSDVDRFLSEDREIFETLKPKVIPDEVSYTPTGEVRWYQTIKQPLISSDGKVIQVLGVSTDITARKLVEEQLRHSEEQLRLALEAAQMGTWDWHLETGKCTCSHNLERLYGLAPNTFERTYEAFLSIIHPNDRDRVHQDTQSALQKGGDGSLEFRIIHPDGIIRWIESKYQVFTNEIGEPYRMSGVNLDITHRKEAEIKIKASLREKDILLQEIHHRVKNNLQVISSLLDLQSDRIQTPEVLELFQESQNRVKSMALVHEKLYQSRDFAKIDFAEYIENLTNYLFQVYAVRSSAIAIELDIENVHLTIDTAIPCGLILSELVSNAIKYAFPQGKVGTIRIALHLQPDNRYTLIVMDNGIGISDDLELKRTQSLGLQLVTILTEQLEGTLEINSDGGTEFKICFPQGKD